MTQARRRILSALLRAGPLLFAALHRRAGRGAVKVDVFYRMRRDGWVLVSQHQWHISEDDRRWADGDKRIRPNRWLGL